jgi:magnesium transporter
MLALTREESTPLIDRRARLRFAHVYDQLYRMVESLDGARLLLAAVLETYRSAVAEATNRVMKVLTVFSAIVLPLTLIAGIYGMNFENMPELRWPAGYFLTLSVMAGTGVGLWIWFARKGYVGGPRLQDLPKAVGLGLLQVAALPVRGIGAVVKTLANNDEGTPAKNP